MRIKVDEDLPRAVAVLLRDKGHEASSVREQQMGGWDDAPLWRAVQAKEQLLITADKGFGDIRHHPPGTHHGVILLRPNEDGIRPLLELMDRLLEDRPLAHFVGTVTVVSPTGIRVRRTS
jgi:predicted nuclease of predicted toxin-antitoxin system